MPVRHILVVDDSKSARLMLRKMLQGFGMTVDTAESAEEALNYLRDRKPDAIFMDHTMPGMDGLVAVRRIKDNPAIASIPVAMYTSRDESAYLDEAHAAGAIGVLTKPAVPEALSALLEQMNQAVDVVIPEPVVSAPAPVPAPVPASGETLTVTPDWVEKIFADKAEAVFYDAVESQVLPLLNDVIAKLRREMEANLETTCNRIATQVCKAQFAEWQPPAASSSAQLTEAALQNLLSPALDERLEAYRRTERTGLEELARNVAVQVCQSQLRELSERLVRQLSTRFADAVQKAGESARESAVNASLEATLQAVEKATADSDKEGAAAAIAERITRQLWADARHDLGRRIYRDLGRRIYLAAGVAAVLGIGAAALVYGLR